MGIRREARKLAVQVLYTADNLGIDADKAWKILEDDVYAGHMTDFACKLVDGTLNNLDYIDGVISGLAKNWDMERIAKVDISIIRMGVYEMLYEKDIPSKVSINEAVELAKYFSTEKSHRFVNGILDAAKKKADEL